VFLMQRFAPIGTLAERAQQQPNTADVFFRLSHC
jgi:hypothetical protein